MIGDARNPPTLLGAQGLAGTLAMIGATVFTYTLPFCSLMHVCQIVILTALGERPGTRTKTTCKFLILQTA